MIIDPSEPRMVENLSNGERWVSLVIRRRGEKLDQWDLYGRYAAKNGGFQAYKHITVEDSVREAWMTAYGLGKKMVKQKECVFVLIKQQKEDEMTILGVCVPGSWTTLHLEEPWQSRLR